ncbi:type II secretion system protein, partial [Deinococcus soli (ex Cha et al. 2016)]
MLKPTPSTDTSGFTLVELLVAMTVLLVVLG